MQTQPGNQIFSSSEKRRAQKGLALVTGAAHRVGRGIALALAARGYSIGLHYHHSEEPARQTAEEIEQLGAGVLLLQADLSDERQILMMFEKLAGAKDDLSILVNAAAVMQRGNLRSMHAEEWDQTMALNLRAPWLCARETARLIGTREGVIINISDTGASKAWTGFPAYQISKAGIETLTRLLAKTLAPNIRVNAVAPGLVMKSEDTSEEEWQRLYKKLPLGRPGSLESVIRAVTFLIENDYITGQTIIVDGGYQLV
jgi:pteridine reductase